MSDPRVTVIDRLRALGLEAGKRTRWELGAAVRQAWLHEHGELPVKELRTKSSGAGSHCFALYPPEFIPTIDRIVRAAGLAPEQGLPFGPLP